MNLTVRKAPIRTCPIERLQNAIVLIEDRRFFSHGGIDLIAIARSLVANIQARKYVQGGSTITQQLIRTKYLTTEKTLWRKFKECLMALKLELTTSKAQILTEYTCMVYMGHRSNGTRVEGFNEAAKYYFNKLLRTTTIAEQAMLVAMLKGPNIYRPGTERSRIRSTWVLSLMADSGMISADEMRKAVGEL